MKLFLLEDMPKIQKVEEKKIISLVNQSSSPIIKNYIYYSEKVKLLF